MELVMCPVRHIQSASHTPEREGHAENGLTDFRRYE